MSDQESRSIAELQAEIPSAASLFSEVDAEDERLLLADVIRRVQRCREQAYTKFFIRLANDSSESLYTEPAVTRVALHMTAKGYTVVMEEPFVWTVTCKPA